MAAIRVIRGASALVVGYWLVAGTLACSAEGSEQGQQPLGMQPGGGAGHGSDASGSPASAGSGGGAQAGTAGTMGQAGAEPGGAGTNGGAAGDPGGAAGTGAAGNAAPDGGTPNEGNDHAMVDPVGNANRAPGFVDLSPEMGEPLPEQGSPVTPEPPAGWTWYAIDGAICRNGSPAGFYLRRGTGDGLLIYFEGGGACSNANYCSFNPASVDEVLAGDGEVVIGSALGAGPGRQQPGVYTDASHTGAPAGIFDIANAANPFKDWHQVYIPYCTGDVHFGTRRNGMVPNLAEPQQFVGYYNTQKFIGRIVPTFKDSVTQVVVTGSSAGSFGAALNFSMIQDAFGDVPVSVIGDSGAPFEDEYMPVCMQQKWRGAWGLTEAMPPDCDECRRDDGGGMIRFADFLMRKHPNARIAMISSMEDEVIRLFFSVGLGNCSAYADADPVAVVLFQFDETVYFPAHQYSAALTDLRETYLDTGRFASYYMAGDYANLHQHIFRQRFYESPAGGISIAKFVGDFVNGTVTVVGP